jgi:hypothetical protein
MTKNNVYSKIEYWPLDRLVPYARNSRTHSDEQVAQIAASIREFGFTNPILVDTEAGILAGHARLLAAQSLPIGSSASYRTGPSFGSPETSLYAGRQ